jgi:hypothetical protein
MHLHEVMPMKYRAKRIPVGRILDMPLQDVLIANEEYEHRAAAPLLPRGEKEHRRCFRKQFFKHDEYIRETMDKYLGLDYSYFTKGA